VYLRKAISGGFFKVSSRRFRGEKAVGEAGKWQQ
jgi:hypothetical protein